MGERKKHGPQSHGKTGRVVTFDSSDRSPDTAETVVTYRSLYVLHDAFFSITIKRYETIRAY